MPMFIFNLLLTFPYLIPRIQSAKHVDLCTTMMLQICNIPAESEEAAATRRE